MSIICVFAVHGDEMSDKYGGGDTQVFLSKV